MGIFKDDLNLDLQYAFLINLGFKYKKQRNKRNEWLCKIYKPQRN